MSELRSLAVLTTGRQDYGILRSTILLLRDDAQIRATVWAGGMHLRERFGPPLALLAADGVRPARQLDFLGEPPEPAADAARALTAVAAALREECPDALLLAGDRSETLAAGLGAALASVPIVHVHGGEETEGAVDNVCRHALTKLSHLHLVSHERHAARVRQMGEPPETVVVVGAPGLDNLCRPDLPSRAEVAATLRHPLPDPLVLVTVHPTTLGDEPEAEVRAVADALATRGATYVITQPNADVGGDTIRRFWAEWARGRPNVVVVDALGEKRYWALLREAAAVVGNSSSGIVEAPAAGVPVVNVGERQRGRLRSGRVIDAPARADAVAEALEAALSGTVGAPAAPAGYPPGPVAPRIVAALRRWQPPRPPQKRFRDLP